MPLRVRTLVSISAAFGSFIHLPSQGSNGSFVKFVERLSAIAPVFVSVLNFGPAAAAPAAPAPTALKCTVTFST